MHATDAGNYDCTACTDKLKKQRNCRNWQKHPTPIHDKADWDANDGRFVEKIQGTKFYECPVSAITSFTWHILELVNDCLDAEGNLIHLPYDGSLLRQPFWFRQSYRLVKIERGTWNKRKLDAHKEKLKRNKR